METSKLKESLVLKLSELEPCRQKAEITIPAATVSSEMNIIATGFSQQANIPGFRAGKTPLQIVKKRYKENIEQELLRQFHITAFENIRRDSKAYPVTMPTPESEPLPPKIGEEYKFTLTFDSAPNFKLPEYKGLKLKKAEIKVPEKHINDEINRFRDMYAEFKTVDSKSEKGDMLKISFTSDLECPEDALQSYKRLVNAEDSWCWLSEPEMLPGLIEGLTGMKAGDKKDLTIDFPTDFTEPQLAGKKGQYKITIIEVQRRIPLEDDKELCKRLNVDNIKVLKDQIKKSKMAQEEQAGKIELQQKTLAMIIKKVGDIDLPPSMLAQSVQMHFRQIANDLVKTEADMESFTKDTEKHQKVAKDAAKNRLINYFIAKAISEKENIAVNQEDIDARIKALSSAYGYKEKDLRKQMDENGGVEELHIDLTIEKVASFLLDNAKFDDVKESSKDKKKSESKGDKKIEKKDSKKK